MSNFKLSVFKKASLSRNFENETFKKLEQKIIQLPVYLSAGQEYIPATIATLLEKKVSPHIFIQHPTQEQQTRDRLRLAPSALGLVGAVGFSHRGHGP